MSGVTLTGAQAHALSLIRSHPGITYRGDPNVYSPVTSGPTGVDGSFVWINYRTAQALENRGLGRIEGYGEECEFALFPVAEDDPDA